MKNFFCLIIIVFILIVITYFNNNKEAETNELINQNAFFENIIENTIQKNIITSENIISSEEESNSTKTVKYEFTSADNMAAQGNPGILKIFDLTNTKLEFEYNHGWNFTESTIDRKIFGIAEIKEENIYEFNENIDGHKYSITFNVSEEMVTLSEYIDEDLLSMINLWS